MLVEQWEDASQRTINPAQVTKVVPHVDNTIWHCHVAFGRAEAWDLNFHGQDEALTVNGVPRGLESLVPNEHRHLLSAEQLSCAL